MRYYKLTFDSYSGILDHKHTVSRDKSLDIDLDSNGNILVPETELPVYFKDFNVFKVEYAGDTMN
ncbi:MAG: hypothetical protein GX660_03710 [Clostridiaceae bacterium]|nr:hypothetical protein [Clostridiaceae bacterium]